MKTKRVVSKTFEISFSTSNRMLPDAINEFLSDINDLEGENWDENHSILRDYEGDFDGILIYNNDDTKSFLTKICKKVGESYDDLTEFEFKLTW